MTPQFRPEIMAHLHRWREVLTGAGLALAGLWVFARGGLFFQALGAVLAAGGIGWAVQGLRRLRFHRPARAPGVVDVLEGQISYLSPHPGRGGFVSIPGMVEIGLLSRPGERAWRIAQEEGPAVLIPVDALGAERLFDVFAGLPGLDMAALIVALEDPGPASDRLLWRRPRHRVAGPPQP